MTDRTNYLIVALEQNMRTDDAEGLLDAIRQLRGVADVKANVAQPSDWVAETRARQDLTDKLWAVLQPKP